MPLSIHRHEVSATKGFTCSAVDVLRNTRKLENCVCSELSKNTVMNFAYLIIFYWA